MGSLEELTGVPDVSSTHSVPAGFSKLEVVGTYLPGTGTLGWGAQCGAESPCS